MRRVIVDNGWVIPANSPNDTTLKINIATDLMELATNHARDTMSREERGALMDGPIIIDAVNVREVLKHDLGLREILGMPVSK